MNQNQFNRQFDTDYSDVINQKMNENLYNIPRQNNSNPTFFNPVNTRTSNMRNQNSQFGDLSINMENRYHQIQKQHAPISFQPMQSRQESKTNFNRQRSWQIQQNPNGFPNVKKNLENKYRQQTSIQSLLNKKESNYQQQQFNYPRQQNPLFQPNRNNHQLSNNYLNFNDNHFNQNRVIEINKYNKPNQPNKKELANQKIQSRNMIPNFSPAPIIRNPQSSIVPDRLHSYSSSQEF